MGQRGTKPKPTALKLIEGNPGKRPLNVNEPKPKPKRPACPAWLNKEARKMWKRLAPELDRLGLLTVVDGEAFAAACQSYGIWAECEQILKAEGRTVLVATKAGEHEAARPEVAIGNAALKNFKMFCSEFGLTPSSRTGIHIDKTEEQDAFRELLSG